MRKKAKIALTLVILLVVAVAAIAVYLFINRGTIYRRHTPITPLAPPN